MRVSYVYIGNTNHPGNALYIIDRCVAHGIGEIMN